MDKKQLREEEVVKAVEALKKHKYGMTGIKIELEANLNRRTPQYTSICDDCNEGRIRCSSCASNLTYDECNACEGSGEIYDDEYDDYETCDACGGSGEVGCSTCSPHQSRFGVGFVPCSTCNGEFRRFPRNTTDFNSTYACNQYILKKLHPLGLSTRSRIQRKYIPKKPLVYTKFYVDGSVDSEFTATISVEKAENVLFLPKIVEAFNALAKENGGGCDTAGAGMHMAFVTGKDGKYPSNHAETTDSYQKTRYMNYQDSMALLLPALYFLGTHNENTRGLSYRIPKVSDMEKRCAVSYRNGALEFRVFDTCYDMPEAVLDNVVVMKNSMKYWRKGYLDPGLSKIAKAVKFGRDNDRKLERLYVSASHMALLNEGLERLKPSYYTITELKKQRNFKLKMAHFINREKLAKEDARKSYKEYEERFGWKLKYLKASWEGRFYNDVSSGYRKPPKTPEEKAKFEKEIEAKVKKTLDDEAKKKKDLNVYVDEQVAKMQGINQGSYELKAKGA